VVQKSSSEVLETASGLNALNEEIESLAWAVAKIPTYDVHGHEFKAALYALLVGMESGKPPANAAEAVLISLIRDLVRDTPWWPLLGPHGMSGSRATRRVHRRRSGDRVAATGGGRRTAGELQIEGSRETRAYALRSFNDA
jgi:hypothetical protein